MSQALQGQIVIVQAAELMQTKTKIPDGCHMDAVFCCVYCNCGLEASSQAARTNGLSNDYRKGKSALPMAKQGHVRPEFQAGGSRKSTYLIQTRSTDGNKLYIK